METDHLYGASTKNSYSYFKPLVDKQRHKKSVLKHVRKLWDLEKVS